MNVIIPKDGFPNREALREFLKQHEYCLLYTSRNLLLEDGGWKH